MWLLLKEASVDRREVVTWNVVPRYVERTSLGSADIAAARWALREFFSKLQRLRVVVLLGRRAALAWDQAGVDIEVTVIRAPHPSPLSLNLVPERRDQIRKTLVRARELADER
jgi:uracil-DNA glycosylase